MLYKSQYAITLTGMDPEGGPLTFKIIPVPCPNFDSLGILYVTPCHQDVTQSMGMTAGLWYRFVDPITGVVSSEYSPIQATTSSTVDITVYTPSGSISPTAGAITVSPATAPFTIIYTPNFCHDYFTVDTLTFVAIDAAGLVSAPATVTMNSNAASVVCQHGF
ncbi:MAG: hypothetical protein HY207_03525 [Nitrospirae bacterium]|nr:hypothetical protein [Nitrospirota bacterium]